MHNKSLYHHISWRHTIDFPGRCVPRVLLEDGRPGFVINQWIFGLLEAEISPSKLDHYVRSVMLLYDFYIARKKAKPEAHPDDLLKDFIDAKRYGTDCHCIKQSKWLHSLGLFWTPLSTRTSTIQNYLNAINKFDIWHAKWHGAKRINPSETHFLTEFEQYREFVNRSGWDMFAYLYSAKKNRTKEEYETNYNAHIHRRFTYKLASVPKALPFHSFIELVEKTPNPRDKLLWLIMAGGSLRSSETLHLFYNDIKYDKRSGLPEVLLTDPEVGMTTYEDPKKGFITKTRAQFFRDVYPIPGRYGHLQPRTLYGKKDAGLHAGFKGMCFGDSNASCLFNHSTNNEPQHDVHTIFWSDIRFQNYFRIVLEEYISEYFHKNYHNGNHHPKDWPYHPWLFISTQHTYGTPLTIAALRKAWSRAIKRIGLSGKYGVHSLRHLYGYYLARDPKMTLEMAQIYLHHSVIDSSKVYFRYRNTDASNIMIRSVIEQEGYDPDCYLLTDSTKIEFPSHWSEGLRKTPPRKLSTNFDV